MQVTAALAEFAATARPGPGPLAMMRLSLADWCACGAAGAAEPVAGVLRRMVLDEGGRGEAGLIGGGRVPARAAALVNGTISHALDYDDTHFAHIGHPSVAVIPAALALAERQGATGAALLDACLIGVEASIRVGVWLGRGHYQAGFHQTATAGAFGATLAAGRLLGLNAAGLRQALGLAATRAGGLKAQFGTMGKPYNAGMAAAGGVECALLATGGMVSREDALEAGFGPTHHGAAEGSALEGLGGTWLFDQISHKFHACCHGLHAMLEALSALEIPEPVEAVEVATHPRWLTVCNIPRPVTGLEAKFSFRLTAAMALAGRDTAAPGSFTDTAAADPALVAQRDRVSVVADEALPETASRVTVLAGGTRYEAHHDLAEPLPPAVRAAKLAAKARALVGPERAAALEEAVSGADPAGLGAWLAG